MSLKANRGEWSELYAFLKILCDRYLHAGDEKTDQLLDITYKVRQIIRTEGGKNSTKIFHLVSDAHKVLIQDAQGNIRKIDSKKICKILPSFFESIKNQPSSEGSFASEKGEKLMSAIGIHKIKASSSKKTDITLVIDEAVMGTEPSVNFSIKSQLGSASTLLNASSHTNFIYSLEGISAHDLQHSHDEKIQVNSILNMGGTLRFSKIDSKNFEMNLRKIDTMMPEILAQIVLAFYQGVAMNMSDLVNYITNNNPLGIAIDKDFYKIKIKEVLFHVALGMMPATAWAGSLDAHGGYIIVRSDGELVCYHVYNFDRFKRYLLENTKLEKPSTTKHGYGKVFVADGNAYLKLNLQIRFIK